MSLLDQASLIVTPNAYNVSKLYSVIPNTTLGDMTVSRALSATRVNEQKFIEIARTNLLLRSEEFDNASWEKNASGINTSIGTNGIESNVANAPSGTLTADRVNFILQTPLDPDIGLKQVYAAAVATQSFVASIYVKGEGSNIGKQIRLRIKRSIGGSLALIDTTITLTSNWVRITSSALTLVASNTGVQYIISSNDATNALIWGAQLETGNVATEYIPTTTSIRTKFAGITQDGSVAQNIPRIDYPPLGGCPSILSEPARTNLVLYSEEFDNNNWGKTNVVVTANSTASPNGTLTADLISYNSTTNLLSFSATNAIATSYTISVFAKKGTGSVLRIREVFYTGTASTFDLNTGTVISTTHPVNVTVTSSIINYGNGWYRCTITQSYTNLQTSINWSFDSNSNINNLYLWGAQCEEGSTLTSYIPTTTAAVLRNADVTYNISATTLIGQTQGTIYAEFIGTKDILGVNKYICIIGGGSKSIHIAFYLSVINIVSSPPIDLSVSFTPNLNYKIAVCYSNTGNFRIYVNGFKYHEVNTYVPSTFSTLGIGNTVAGTNQVNSNIKSAVLWKTALTDDQCILLTGASFSTYPEMANNFPNTLIYTLQ